MPPGTQTTTSQSPPAGAPPRRPRRLAVVAGVVLLLVGIVAAHLLGSSSTARRTASRTTSETTPRPGTLLTSPAAATGASPSLSPRTSPVVSSTTSAVASPTTPATPATVSAQDARADLREAVRAANRGVPGRLSVAVTDLRTGITASSGAPDHGFATASIVKADILCALLRRRHGQLSSGQRSIARRMIEQSDNDAASALWRVIGGADGLDEANERFGLTSTRGGRAGMWGTTTTTARDQLQLLRTIFTAHSALPARSRAYIRSLMGDVEPDQDWGVSAADTRSGERYFVKNGWLPRTATGLWVVNSIGSVQYHGHPLLIAVLSDGRHSMGQGVRVLEKASRAAARAVTGL